MRWLAVIFLSLLVSCSSTYVELEPEDRYIFPDKVLEFELSLGVDINAGEQSTFYILENTIKEIEKELNIKFNVKLRRIVFLNEEDGLEQLVHCAMQLNPEKREADKHLNLCVVPKPLKQKGKRLTLGVYAPKLGIAVISRPELDILFRNTIVHEIGHFLGALHTKHGIMKDILPERGVNEKLKFDAEAIEQIRNKQLPECGGAITPIE